jgi:hypothetical protein
VFDFGQNLGVFIGNDNGVVPSNGGGKFVPPTKGKYVMKCTNSIIKNSGKNSDGAPCWYLSFDISRGEHAGKFAKYPRMVYQSLGNDVGKGFAQRYIQMFIKNNPDMISPDVLNGSTFDESQLVGLEIGAELDHTKNEKYLEIVTLLNIDQVA